MSADSTLKMSFKLDDEKTHNISLKDPKDGLQKSQVEAFANLVIEKEAILKNGAMAEELTDAYIERRERVELAQ